MAKSIDGITKARVARKSPFAKVSNRVKAKWAGMTQKEREIFVGKLVVIALILAPFTLIVLHWLLFKHSAVLIHKAVATHTLTAVPPIDTSITPMVLPDPSTLATAKAVKAHHAAKAIHHSINTIPWNTIITTSGQL